MAKHKTSKVMSEDGEPLAKIGRRGMLSFLKKQLMFAVAVRNPTVFEFAHKVLKDADVAKMGEFYAVIWRCVRKCYKQTNQLPDAQIMLTDVNNELIAYPTLLTPDEIDECEEFIKGYIFEPATWQDYDVTTSPMHAKEATKVVRQFKDELVAEDLSLLIRDGTVSNNLMGVLQEKVTAIAAAAVESTAPTDDLFDEGWQHEKQPKLEPTGVSILDEFIGGQTAGEVYLFFGPFSSCKTTLAVQAFCIAIKAAKERTDSENAAYEQAGSKKRVLYKAVYVTYETKKNEVRQRCLAFLANISRDRMLGVDSVATMKDLRKTGEPIQKYEKKLYAKEISEGKDVATLPGEWERVEAAVEVIRKHGIFLDMTSVGSEINPKGCGGMLELAARLKSQVELDKCQLSVVWIDHLAAMVDNMIGSDDKFTDDNKRHILKRAPKQAVDFIGVPMSCPVWIVHQFSGAANERGSTAQFHHTDGDECKTVGMFADFCIVTGPATKDGNQFCVFDVTKFRRKPPNSRKIVKIEGEFNRVVNMSDLYCIEGMTIMTHAEAKGFQKTPVNDDKDDNKGGAATPAESTAPKKKKKAAPVFNSTEASL